MQSFCQLPEKILKLLEVIFTMNRNASHPVFKLLQICMKQAAEILLTIVPNAPVTIRS